jgi:hypothetical protein
MDNIIITSDLVKEYGRHHRAVMDILQNNNFKLKRKKYTFRCAEMEFVGYRVTGSRIRLSRQKTDYITK